MSKPLAKIEGFMLPCYLSFNPRQEIHQLIIQKNKPERPWKDDAIAVNVTIWQRKTKRRGKAGYDV